ncbi:secreted RxLR effector protein 161-like [Miscanthus floridulus]|uniref:secreted RxLR effector protein 161-like n=1 Tax=Miscanthus floridulus TaxID=154761 RepID=UPI00345A1E70
MSNRNACETPMEAWLKLSQKKVDEVVDPTAYRSIIGSFRYIVNTRLDLAYSVGVVSRYMEAPGREHWATIKHILRYLKGTIGYGCKYEKGTELKPSFLGYSDSDFAGDVEDRKSTTGVVYFLGNRLVTWASQKQKIVALSSCEAEYVAAAAAACQGVWLSRLIVDLMGMKEAPVKLLMDNMSTIALSRNPVHHDRSKHIDAKYHFIRECIEEGKVDVDHVGTAGQFADIFTKSLGRVKFVELRGALGVV